ncbi:hypothetical protein [Sulfitobacter sp. TBRI5]|uniref:hypothetical protein n=1 Tax=Sulfitobacter sp. TBRI5 TaxID=2989732 RepID=UPI003D9B5ED2
MHLSQCVSPSAAFIATTNETQAVHLDRDDRRWTVIEVAQPFDMTTHDGQESAYAFWEPYHQFMKSPDGPGIVLKYLLDYSVDQRALTYGYGTAAKARDKVSSDPVLSVLTEIAETAVCPHDLPGKGVLSIKTLTEIVRNAGGRSSTPEEVSHRVAELIPHATRCRNARYCERIHTHTTGDGSVEVSPLMETRLRGFDFGSLEEFRRALSRVTLETYDDGDVWMPWMPADFDYMPPKHSDNTEDEADQPF